MKAKELALILASAFLTLILALGAIRVVAPGLLGISVPVDLQMVNVSKEVSPFFDGVFRDEDYLDRRTVINRGEGFLVLDPYILRGKPLIGRSWYNGPHDILGFRNKGIPNNPDIITIGDSQTYGIIIPLEQNWPTQLSELLSTQGRKISSYNMAVGGWGAVEYYEIFRKAVLFGPKLIIVAFYTGNDPIESYNKANSNQRWEILRQRNTFGAEDINDVIFANKKDWGPVRFSDGIVTTFTPVKRMYSNLDHPIVHAGYEIMENAAKEMAKLAVANKIHLIFTIIPTKELVYSVKIKKERISAPSTYISLVQAEARNIDLLSSKLASIKEATYVDLVSPLQNSALLSMPLYSTKVLSDGHPARKGSWVIARTLSSVIKMKTNYPGTRQN